MIDFKKSFFLFKKPANAQQAAYFVLAEKPLYERTPLPDQHPRRPRGSKSGRVRRRDESFQAWAEEPLGTDSHRTNSKRSRGLFPDWAQKMLCIIVPNRQTASPEFFS